MIQSDGNQRSGIDRDAGPFGRRWRIKILDKARSLVPLDELPNPVLTLVGTNKTHSEMGGLRGAAVETPVF
jgi:hypothetical protein